MNRKKKTITSEEGITLIALLVSIIILIILVAVAVRGITGEEGLIKTTGVVAEDYNITSYREQLEQTVRSVIIAYSARGEEPTIVDIATELEKETWIISAEPNTDESLSNGDIIVTVDAGYIFDVFYDSLYGKIHIDYIGKDETKTLPTLTARYETKITSILAEAKHEKGIARIELYYKGELVGTKENPEGEVRFNVKEIGSGEYKIVAISNEDTIRVTYVEVGSLTDDLKPPIISLNPSTADGNADWYKEPVTITITKASDDTAAKSIHYSKKINGITASEDQDITYNEPFTISNSVNSLIIIAWTEDETGKYTSDKDKAIQEIKIDKDKPNISYEPTSPKPSVNGWFKDKVELSITGEDENSGIASYSYQRQGETVWNKKNLAEKLTVTSEGTTTITVITTDVAGNDSDPETIIIQKDTTPPETASIRFKSNTKTSITVEATANDNYSGIASYKFEYKGKTEGSDKWRSLANGVVNTADGAVTYTYNIPTGEYSVRVIVTDAAGNSTMPDANTTITSTSTILNTAPTFTKQATGTPVANTNSQITVTATATDPDEGDTLTYTLYWGTSSSNLTNSGMTQTGTSGQQVSFTKTGLSNYTTYYFRIDVSDNKETTIGSYSSEHTLCESTKCTGPFIGSTTCQPCKGSGQTTTTITCTSCSGSRK